MDQRDLDTSPADSSDDVEVTRLRRRALAGIPVGSSWQAVVVGDRLGERFVVSGTCAMPDLAPGARQRSMLDQENIT